MKQRSVKQQYRKRQCRALSVLFAVLAFAPAFSSCAGGAKIASSGLGNARDAVPFMSNARTGALPSGLRYYLLENAMPENRVFLTLAVNAGSVLETEEERGLAHFVEHMAFNGTARFAKSELVNYLRSLGMRFGPEVNAYTSFDQTVYGIEVPVFPGPDGRKVIPERALAVIDDWSYSIIFDPKDMDSERLVIMEEYRTRLGARERINREMLPILFRGSPYAERLPIGLPEIIENAPASRLEGFYRKWYQPENMAIIIVGDFDAEYLEASLAEYFPIHHENAGNESGAGKPGSQPAISRVFSRPRYNLSEPKKGSFETLVITDTELSQSRVDLYWKRKAEARRPDLAYYREGVIDYLADIMLSLRFDEAAAKSETPYVNAGGGHANYGYSSRFYVLAARAKTASVKATLEELLLVKESLSRYGFTQNETDGAKAYLLSYIEQLVFEKDRQLSNQYVDSFTEHFLRGETVPDLEWELEAVRKLLPGITLKEINKIVKDYFAEDDITVIITAPDAEKDTLPGRAEIQTIAANVRKARIAPPARASAQGELLANVPEPGVIVSETTDAETGALRWKLGNGAELILRETQNKNSELSFYAQARGGTLSVPPEMAVSALLASEMLNASGLGPHSRTDLTKILLDKQVSMSFWTQNYLRGFQGSAAVKDLKTLFEMIYLSFTQPRLDPEAVKVLLDQRRSSMAFQENDPNVVFRREITRTTYGNPRFHPLELADLDKAKMDEALAFIHACLNPADYTFVFTGNLDLPRLQSLVETYLASIPPAPSFSAWADIDPRRPADTDRKVFKGKEERSAVYMAWFTPGVYSEEKSAAVSVLSDYLEIQLSEEIREALGGVYSISSWVSITPIPGGELSGGVFFYCDPKRAEELGAAVKEEFSKIARGGIDREVLAKAVEALIRSQEESVQSNLYIAQSYANSAVIYRSPLSRLDKRPDLYRAVKPADIQQAAAELLKGGFVRLILYPETRP
jgi:zinc protease